MNGANLLGVAAGWLFFRPYAASIVGFTRRRAVLTLLAGSSVAALGSALPAAGDAMGVRIPPLWDGLADVADVRDVQPVVLPAAGAGRAPGWPWQWDGAKLLRPLRQAGPAPLWPPGLRGPGICQRPGMLGFQCRRWRGAPWPTGCSPSRC